MHCIVLASRSDFSPVYVFPYYHEQASAFASAQEIVDAIYDGEIREEAVEGDNTTPNKFDSYFSYDTVIEF